MIILTANKSNNLFSNASAGSIFRLIADKFNCASCTQSEKLMKIRYLLPLSRQNLSQALIKAPSELTVNTSSLFFGLRIKKEPKKQKKKLYRTETFLKVQALIFLAHTGNSLPQLSWLHCTKKLFSLFFEPRGLATTDERGGFFYRWVA